MHFILKSGQTVTLFRLTYHQTYAGLQIGAPSPFVNEEIVRITMGSAGERHPGVPVHLLEPIELSGVRLPPTCWVLSLLSDPLGPGEPPSGLIVVWFGYYDHEQPLGPQLMKAVWGLDWNRLAGPWDW